MTVTMTRDFPPSTVDDYIAIKLVHEIHTSERRSFRACRRRWDWIFRESYYPLTTAKPLEFGSAVHRAMETFYNPETWTWDREVIGQQAVLDFEVMCEAQKKKSLQANQQLQLDSEVAEDYAERVELGRGMLYHYFSKVSPVRDRGWEPVKVEIAFMVAIPNPETGEEYIWCKCDQCWERYTKALVKWRDADATQKSYEARQQGSTITMQPVYSTSEIWGQAARDAWIGLPVVYAGRCDMIAQDEDGNYWVFDWKTCRYVSSSDQIDFLYLDDQIGSYVWALNKIGVAVKGFVYVEIRKGFPKEPQQNKTTRLGRKFSIAKNQDVDFETYAECVMKKDTQAFADGLYDDFLRYLREEGTVFHERFQIGKTPEELMEIERNIGLEALDIIDPKIRIYPSAGRFGCNWCAFRDPCMEKNNKGDYQYALDTLFERREHYYVREEPSTESKGGE